MKNQLRKNINIFYYLIIIIQLIVIFIFSIIFSVIHSSNHTSIYVFDVVFSTSIVIFVLSSSIITLILIKKYNLSLIKNFILILFAGLVIGLISYWITWSFFEHFILINNGISIWLMLLNVLILLILLILLIYFVTIVNFLLLAEDEIEEYQIFNFINVKLFEIDNYYQMIFSKNKLKIYFVETSNSLSNVLEFDGIRKNSINKLFDIDKNIRFVFMSNEFPKMIGDKPDNIKLILKKNLKKEFELINKGDLND